MLKTLALFDFDGTLTSRDSFVDFIWFAVGIKRFIRGLIVLLPEFILYKLGVIPNEKAKETAVSYFFGGWSIGDFDELSLKYSRLRIPNILKKKAVERLSWHRSQGHRIAIVTASLENYLKDWCATQNIDLIATKIEVEDGRLTGKLASRNCYGPEKAGRIREKYDLAEFGRIYAYGDSRGDREMLELARE